MATRMDSLWKICCLFVSSINSLTCKVLKYKRRTLAVMLLLLEIKSFALDNFGGEHWGFFFVSFLISVFGFLIIIYTSFIKKLDPAVTRSEPERQLIAVEIVFAFIQTVITCIDFIKTAQGVKINGNESLLPLASSIISAGFAFRTKEEVPADLLPISISPTEFCNIAKPISNIHVVPSNATVEIKCSSHACKASTLKLESGKRCYIIFARDLSIFWGDDARYWKWTSLPETGFPEVAELKYVWWLEIRGKICTCILSPGTMYAAYLVFKLTKKAYGFRDISIEASVGLVGGDDMHTRHVQLDDLSVPRDELLEIQFGEFFYRGDEEGELEMRFFHFDGYETKSGLIVQGIEIRPKKSE